MRYASIRELDISNGEGVGVALFVQGCPFNPHCYNCFNPETWDFNGGKEWTSEVKERFLELIDRPYIKRVSILGGEPLADKNLDGVLDLVTEINKRYNFQKVDSANPCKMGVSEDKNADEIRLSCPNKSIWLYTGYELSLKTEYIPVDDFWNDEDEKYYYFITDPKSNNISDFKRSMIISRCNIVVDGKYIDSQRNPSKKWTGSDNQRVIDIRQSLEKGEITLWCQ